MAPSVVVTEHDVVTIDGGMPTEEGDALVIGTSGTTGDPRGVVLTMDAVIASATATTTRLGVDPATDRWLSCLPFAHVGGLAVLLRSIVSGTPVEIHPRFDPDAVADAATKGATLVSLVATALRRVVHPDAFRTILLGGSSPFGVLGPNVVVTYGLTESGSGVIYDGIPLDGVEVAIGDDGAISLRGPMLLRAYRDGRDPKSGDGWLSTGDVGSFDELGRLVVHGRADECIVTGGENVWPTAVEAILIDLPGIAEVAVAGTPDPEWGERVVAYVVADGRPPSLAELRSVVRAELGGISAPQALVVLDALPRTSSGKVQRQALHDLAEAT